MFFIFSKNNPYQHSKFANSSNRVIGTIYESTNNVKRYFFLNEEIQLLRQQNKILQNKIKGDRIVVGNYFSRKNDTVFMQQYDFQGASVIRSSYRKSFNYLTINKGRANKVYKNMGVIGTKGILGYVVAVSEHYSTVLPIIHPKFELPVRHKKTKTFGLLSWEEQDYRVAKVKDVASFVDVKVGDTIVTTGGDTYFPEGELVGTVSRYENVPGKGSKILTITLAEDYSNVHSVFTINNIAKIELEQLIDSTEINE